MYGQVKGNRMNLVIMVILIYTTKISNEKKIRNYNLFQWPIFHGTTTIVLVSYIITICDATCSDGTASPLPQTMLARERLEYPGM
jgi:hypothetical protein